jgi:spore photoproduct lyase
MDCRYCALQGYFNRPVLEVFVNMDEIIKALREYRAVHHERFHRICTGEFADSLALDPLTDTASRLVEEFAGYTDCSLELKTKTDFIEPLLDIDPKGRTVLGFSMNLPEVWRKEERFAVSPEKRLRAAQRAAQRGYRVAFHFDPIMPWGDRLPLYGRVVDSIYRKVPAEAVAWISLGVFRFVPGLADVAEQRFGTIPHYHQEFVPGLDGKHRAFVDARIEVCRFMSDRIRGHDPGARVYLCMESRHVWERALGVPMGSDAELTAYLDAAFPAVAPDGGRTERP